jgi:hypothetical protein
MRQMTYCSTELCKVANTENIRRRRHVVSPLHAQIVLVGKCRRNISRPTCFIAWRLCAKTCAQMRGTRSGRRAITWAALAGPRWRLCADISKRSTNERKLIASGENSCPSPFMNAWVSRRILTHSDSQILAYSCGRSLISWQFFRCGAPLESTEPW